MALPSTHIPLSMTIVLVNMMTASICHVNEQVHHLLALLLGWYLLLESSCETETEHIT